MKISTPSRTTSALLRLLAVLPTLGDTLQGRVVRVIGGDTLSVPNSPPAPSSDGAVSLHMVNVSHA